MNVRSLALVPFGELAPLLSPLALRVGRCHPAIPPSGIFSTVDLNVGTAPSGPGPSLRVFKNTILGPGWWGLRPLRSAHEYKAKQMFRTNRQFAPCADWCRADWCRLSTFG
jgi:hypothetical protein